MAQRVNFPADVCDSPDAKCYRTLAEAFPCGLREAVALQRFEQPKAWRWVLLALVAMAAGVVLMGCDAQAADPTTAALASDLKRAALDAFACPGMTAIWLDAQTVQCLKEKP